MPAEQTGIVRDNYLWKVLLRKGASKDGVYLHVPSGAYDYELFSLIWAPVLQALSYVFEKSDEPAAYRRAVQGFERCAAISTHFGMSGNLDAVILTLAKFTTFHNDVRRKPNGMKQFGGNAKAQLAMRGVFSLCHRHGDGVREGWREVFDLVAALFSNDMLPKSYVEVEDFIQPSGKITLSYQVSVFFFTFATRFF